jgi:hypothetical protein
MVGFAAHMWANTHGLGGYPEIISQRAKKNPAHVAGRYDGAKRAQMTDTVKHPIQDDESYSIFITPFRTEADETHFMLQGLSTVPGSTPFGQNYESWEPLRDKLIEHLSLPETALDGWSVQMQFLPGTSICAGRTPKGVNEVYKGTAVKKLFSTP